MQSANRKKLAIFVLSRPEAVSEIKSRENVGWACTNDV